MPLSTPSSQPPCNTTHHLRVISVSVISSSTSSSPFSLSSYLILSCMLSPSTLHSPCVPSVIVNCAGPSAPAGFKRLEKLQGDIEQQFCSGLEEKGAPFGQGLMWAQYLCGCLLSHQFIGGAPFARAEDWCDILEAVTQVQSRFRVVFSRAGERAD